MKKIIVFVTVILLSSCASKIQYDGINVKNFKTNYDDDLFEATFEDLEGDTYRTINLEENEKIQFTYSVFVNSGSLELSLTDMNGNIAWKSEMISSDVTNVASVKVKENNSYKILARGKKASGNFKIEWKTNNNNK